MSSNPLPRRSMVTHLNCLDPLVRDGNPLVVQVVLDYHAKKMNVSEAHVKLCDEVESFRLGFQKSGLVYAGNRKYREALRRRLTALHIWLEKSKKPELSRYMADLLEDGYSELAKPVGGVEYATDLLQMLREDPIEDIFRGWEIEGPYDPVQFKYVMDELKKRALRVLGGIEIDDEPSERTGVRQNAERESSVAQVVAPLRVAPAAAPYVNAGTNHPQVSTQTQASNVAQEGRPELAVAMSQKYLKEHPELGGILPRDLAADVAELNRAMLREAKVTEENLNESHKGLEKAGKKKISLIEAQLRLRFMSPGK